MYRSRFTGNTKAEYAMIFGLVVIVSIASLGMLGGSVSDLLGKKVGGALGSENGGGGTSKLMGLIQPAPVQIDPVSGLPISRFSYAGAADTNATSVQNDKHNEVGTMMLGNAMRRLAEETDDPNLRAAFLLAAEKMLYMGGAQAAAKGMPAVKGKMKAKTVAGIDAGYVTAGVDPYSSAQIFLPASSQGRAAQPLDYNSKDAVIDVTRFGGELDNIMKSIPPDFNNPDYVEAMALAQDAMKIGTKYVNDVENNKPVPTARTIDDADGVPKESLKESADVILSDNQVQDVDVKVTFTDAKLTEKIAKRKKATSPSS